MSASSNNTTESRPLQVYRIPVHQKRSTGTDNYTSIPMNRPPFAFRRRHSTPSTSTVRLIELKSPQSNAVIKYYPPHTRTTRAIREESLISNTLDASKSPPTRPVSLLKQRHEDERAIRTATTQTNLNANNDIIIPVAKKSRHIIVEIPVNRDKLSRKREKAIPLDLERDISGSDEETCRVGTSKSKSYKFCKCCYRKCTHRFSFFNICQWYYNCPIFCWIACLLLGVCGLVRILIQLVF